MWLGYILAGHLQLDLQSKARNMYLRQFISHNPGHATDPWVWSDNQQQRGLQIAEFDLLPAADKIQADAFGAMPLTTSMLCFLCVPCQGFTAKVVCYRSQSCLPTASYVLSLPALCTS